MLGLRLRLNVGPLRPYAESGLPHLHRSACRPQRHAFAKIAEQIGGMSRRPRTKRKRSPSRRPRIHVWLAAVVVAAGLLAFPELSALAVDRDGVVVGAARVIDGDTIEVGGQRIRLHAIDAPESAQTCERRGFVWPCGQAATNALRNRIGNRTVSCREAGQSDRYGRFIGVCYVQGEDLNAWMVAQGWALAYRRFGVDYVSEEEAARAARRGIWETRFVAPWDWRRGDRG